MGYKCVGVRVVCAAAIVMAALGVKAQGTQFGGTWVLDKAASVLGPTQAELGQQLVVTDTGTSVRVITQEPDKTDDDYTCRTDAVTCEQETTGSHYVRTARKRGSELMWEIKMTRRADGASLSYTEQWTLSDNGRTLTIHTVYTPTRASMRVFHKKGGGASGRGGLDQP